MLRRRLSRVESGDLPTSLNRALSGRSRPRRFGCGNLTFVPRLQNCGFFLGGDSRAAALAAKYVVRGTGGLVPIERVLGSDRQGAEGQTDADRLGVARVA